MGDQIQTTPHVAILPSPGMGHLFPLGEFAKRLVHQHNFSVTLIALAAGHPSKEQKAYLHSLGPSIGSRQLPPADLDDIPADAKIETRISVTVARSLPPLRDVIASLKRTAHLTALVVDLFATDALDVAKEFDLHPFIFFPPNAMALSVFLHLPELDRAIACEYRDMPDPLELPGCVPIRGEDLLDPIQDRSNEAYSWLLHHSKRFLQEAEGILVNTFVDLEPGAIGGLLKEEKSGDEKKARRFPPVYPVGPLVQSSTAAVDGGAADDHHQYSCLNWLEEQPRGSVLFVSFGSGGTLSSEQITELAHGLELSEQRFVWVVRRPNDGGVPNASFFDSHGGGGGAADNNKLLLDGPSAFLPDGFLDRTKGVGRVLLSWAPQIEILDHPSTGGFLTHCGWNSVLESVVKGVPLIAWPLYAEQKMNALMLVEDIKVAIRPEINQKKRGLVERHEIARVVKALMEGEEGKKLRSRMRDLKEAGARALAQGGSSYNALCEVASSWKKNKTLT
ncbi:hypothetical protein H6P81_014535 [Aristolochia fimbriata]|uniref:Glycosyltransferase n=1 Tax=Aristolochia fimbriata TaxID=158543 RepID=A0AAV7ELE0_ARIFI|nr:hypothetical protein H6P81_014535 [Aristolochia fimbriata]